MYKASARIASADKKAQELLGDRGAARVDVQIRDEERGHARLWAGGGPGPAGGQGAATRSIRSITTGCTGVSLNSPCVLVTTLPILSTTSMP